MKTKYLGDVLDRTGMICNGESMVEMRYTDNSFLRMTEVLGEDSDFIKEFFGQFQPNKLKGEILIEILMVFTEKNICCLCIRDSFIIQKRYKQQLYEAMRASYVYHVAKDPKIIIIEL